VVEPIGRPGRSAGRAARTQAPDWIIGRSEIWLLEVSAWFSNEFYQFFSGGCKTGFNEPFL